LPQTLRSVAAGWRGQKAPPDITGAANGDTQQETWFEVVGHSVSWRVGTMRYAGALACGDVISTYAGANKILSLHILFP
jgi:hypothetical protein